MTASRWRDLEHDCSGLIVNCIGLEVRYMYLIHAILLFCTTDLKSKQLHGFNNNKIKNKK